MDSLAKIRIGTGFDIHAFSAKKPGPVIIGTHKIPHQNALEGHSDADVLIHAVVDALLGASAMGDIGTNFPSTDPQWKGASSDHFLTWSRDQLSSRSIQILSIDSVLLAQEPRISPHLEAIRQKMSALLKIDESRFSLKATTTDKLGFIGRQEGIGCQSSCLICLP